MTRGNTVDLGESMGRAVHAAKSGDLDSLEVELRRLRGLELENMASVGTQLRSMARSVRAHPSFRAAPQAQAV